MYVDDSGNPNIEDETQYYVISGVIINTCDLFHIEIELENFRRKYFGCCTNLKTNSLLIF